MGAVTEELILSPSLLISEATSLILSSPMKVQDLLYELRRELWSEKERERVSRPSSNSKKGYAGGGAGDSSNVRNFNSSWYPMEWEAFLRFGPVAGDIMQCDDVSCALATDEDTALPMQSAISSSILDNNLNLGLMHDDNSNMSLNNMGTSHASASAGSVVLAVRCNSFSHDIGGIMSRMPVDTSHRSSLDGDDVEFQQLAKRARTSPPAKDHFNSAIGYEGMQTDSHVGMILSQIGFSSLTASTSSPPPSFLTDGVHVEI